jgi:hypothetical protein
VTLRGSADERVRTTTAVLVRKMINKDMYDKLTEAAQAFVRAELLHSIEQDSIPNIQKKVSDTVGEIASYLDLEKGTRETLFSHRGCRGTGVVRFTDWAMAGAWPEILPFMFRCAKSPSASHRECAFLIFSQLAMSMEGAMKVCRLCISPPPPPSPDCAPSVCPLPYEWGTGPHLHRDCAD